MLNVKSLSEQIYEFIRDQLHSGVLLPGASINMNEMSAKLGVSKTPLRDALIQLESEGFVTILPRKGIEVNVLTLQDVKHSYQSIGALEGAVIADVFEQLGPLHTGRMDELNRLCAADLNAGRFDGYYNHNLQFHDVYLHLSENMGLRKFIKPLKQRLYDFPRRNYIVEWELRNCDEHQAIIQAVRAGDKAEAVRLVRDVHWSFEVQEPYIRRFHSQVTAELEARIAS